MGFLVGNHPHLHANAPFPPGCREGRLVTVGSPRGLGSPQGIGSWEEESARCLPWKSLFSAPKFLCSGVFIERSLTLQPLLCGALPSGCSSTSRGCRIRSHFAGFSGLWWQQPDPSCWQATFPSCEKRVSFRPGVSHKVCAKLDVVTLPV